MSEELIARARAAAERAYAPYSHFRVGAVAVDADGNTYEGVNLENGAYGSTICAEAGAIAAAIAGGATKIDTIAVACIDAETHGYPCGNCRQLMVEFDVDTIIVDGPGGPRTHTLDALLPHGFTL